MRLVELPSGRPIKTATGGKVKALGPPVMVAYELQRRAELANTGCCSGLTYWERSVVLAERTESPGFGTK